MFSRTHLDFFLPDRKKTLPKFPVVGFKLGCRVSPAASTKAKPLLSQSIAVLQPTLWVAPGTACPGQAPKACRAQRQHPLGSSRGSPAGVGGQLSWGSQAKQGPSCGASCSIPRLCWIVGKGSHPPGAKLVGRKTRGWGYPRQGEQLPTHPKAVKRGRPLFPPYGGGEEKETCFAESPCLPLLACATSMATLQGSRCFALVIHVRPNQAGQPKALAASPSRERAYLWHVAWTPATEDLRASQKEPSRPFSCHPLWGTRG